MFKKFVFLFLFIFLVSFGSCLEFSISPPNLEFEMQKGDLICKALEINVEGNQTIIGKDKWADIGTFERKLSKHNLTSEELEIDIDYPKEFAMNDFKEVEVCLSGETEGGYHGVLLYRVKDALVGVGIWLNFSVEKVDKGFVKLTGKVIGDGNSVNLIFILTIALLIVLVGLVFLVRKKKN